MEADRKHRTVMYILGGSLLVISIIFGGLWLLGQEVAAILVLVGLIVMATFAVATRWTRQTMAMGGELMLRAQESDDRRDSTMIREIGNLARVLMRQAQDQPALPLPDQAGQWLPSPMEMDDVLDIEMNELGD